MRPIGIITDSHSSITQEEAKKLGIWVLPMPFYIDGECYLEGVNLTREEFFAKLESGSAITTSQPSPADVCDVWDWALKEFEKVLYMPLSSGLSGSCETAMALARDEEYEGRVLVVDHGQIATPLHQLILDTLELIEKGYSARNSGNRQRPDDDLYRCGNTGVLKAWRPRNSGSGSDWWSFKY